MTRDITASAILGLVATLPAQADQFAVRLDAAFDGASADLLAALDITLIEGFSENDADYLVLDAPSEAHVEAFLYAIERDARELHALDADWSNPVMRELTASQRIGFLRAMECEFCTG